MHNATDSAGCRCCRCCQCCRAPFCYSRRTSDPTVAELAAGAILFGVLLAVVAATFKAPPVVAAIASVAMFIASVAGRHLQKTEGKSGLLIALSRVVAGLAIGLAFGMLLVMGALLGA